jgi:hypothetical protein
VAACYFMVSVSCCSVDLQLGGRREHLSCIGSQKNGSNLMKEEFYILEVDEEFMIISITDRGARLVRRGFNSREEALREFPQAA